MKSINRACKNSGIKLIKSCLGLKDFPASSAAIALDPPIYKDRLFSRKDARHARTRLIYTIKTIIYTLAYFVPGRGFIVCVWRLILFTGAVLSVLAESHISTRAL